MLSERKHLCSNFVKNKFVKLQKIVIGTLGNFHSFPMPPSRHIPLIVFASSLQLYLLTLCPTINGGDAGELVAEGCSLGTAHPPGYPLYTVVVYFTTALGKVLNLSFPPAYLVNIVSATLGALSSAIIAFLVESTLNMAHQGSKDSASYYSSAAFAAGMLYTVSPLTWQYHTTAEVFALNNFLSALILLTGYFYIDAPNQANLMSGAFVCGLAMCNQHTTILFEIPLILAMINAGKLYLPANFPKLISAGVSYLVGISMYALLPIFSTLNHHPGSWGDVQTVKGLFNHFVRADYGSFQLYSGDTKGTEGFQERTMAYFDDFNNEQGGFPFPYGAVIFVVAGWFFLSSAKNKKARFFGCTLTACFVFYCCIFHTLSNLPLHNPLLFGVHQRFWQQPNIVLFIFMGFGLGKTFDLDFVLDGVRGSRKGKGKGKGKGKETKDTN